VSGSSSVGIDEIMEGYKMFTPSAVTFRLFVVERRLFMQTKSHRRQQIYCAIISPIQE
jgi:hypothetical protein